MDYMKNKDKILYVVIGLLAILLIVCFICCMKMNSHYDRGMERGGKMSHSMSKMKGMQGSMDGMMMGLSGKTGDEFDKAFIKEMIVHHEGAVAMAQMALTTANHEEIKTLSKAIITAQTREIDQMKAWLKTWYNEDYTSSEKESVKYNSH